MVVHQKVVSIGLLLPPQDGSYLAFVLIQEVEFRLDKRKEEVKDGQSVKENQKVDYARVVPLQLQPQQRPIKDLEGVNEDECERVHEYEHVNAIQKLN